MNIKVNDKEMQVADGLKLAQLLAQLQVPEKGTAVAINDTLAKKDTWAERQLLPGDNVLIISAAYGG
ncbi:MAG: sulfur carrier protein ThiS [Bacteroidales bacterium]|nr:sulfur carrier protein ThiS [Bacteroidales bacterium]